MHRVLQRSFRWLPLASASSTCFNNSIGQYSLQLHLDVTFFNSAKGLYVAVVTQIPGQKNNIVRIIYNLVKIINFLAPSCTLQGPPTGFDYTTKQSDHEVWYPQERTSYEQQPANITQYN